MRLTISNTNVEGGNTVGVVPVKSTAYIVLGPQASLGDIAGGVRVDSTRHMLQLCCHAHREG